MHYNLTPAVLKRNSQAFMLQVYITNNEGVKETLSKWKQIVIIIIELYQKNKL